MDPYGRYMRIEDDSDSSFSCGPTPPNPNNDNDTSCILRLSPESLQRDLLPRAPPPATTGGLRNLVYDQAYEPPQPAPHSLGDAIESAHLPENLEEVPALDLDLPRNEPLDTKDVTGHITTDITVGEDRPASATSKETSSEGSAEEALQLLVTPQQAEIPTEEKLLHLGSAQTLDRDAARKLSYQEMERVETCCSSCNWPLIRNVFVGVSGAIWLALLAVCVGWIVSMPRKCDPFKKWYQGEAMYELFPGSFQDSNGDGVGDLPGLQSRLYYVKNLGASTIVLTGIFQTGDFPTDIDNVINHKLVDPKLGTSGDFLNMVEDAHAMGLHVILTIDPVPLLTSDDSDLTNPTPSNGTGASHLQDATYPALLATLEHWLLQGVDGFLVRGLERAVDRADVESLVQEVRNLLDRYTVGMEDRIMVVPLELLRAIQEHDRHNATKVLHRVDLLDCQLQIEGRSPQQIVDQITEIMSWDASADVPWFTWHLSSPEDTRLSRRLGRGHSVGATLLQSLLPGTVTVLYGDEVCLMETESETNQTVPGLGIMPWSDDVTSADFTLSSRLPWRPLPEGHHLYNADSQQNISVQSVRAALQTHSTAVPIYVNGIYEAVGDFNPKRSSNLMVRYLDSAVLVLDRFYPRQPRWCVIFNTSPESLTRDLSHIFFRGLVVASSTGDKEGFIRFKQLRLEPGEGLLVKLDR
ncbi:neutral and basic amino acid transport protein rBAT-like [Amphibalanus amphitrite]|uniref:neutral and basic amino acid transport protein rBAT-like n=1 Tax=Amphibalanus amphitrite TaxID=1232801 RepID=UPI001C911E5D|nr:neutral and basic amino acid transport protein rBAT-like [Amphibalanus amphitrite]